MRKSTKSIQSILLELYKQHQSNKKWNTASLYRSVIIKVNKFAKGKEIPINNISPSWLKSFEGYMRSSGNCWNTISTYMRILNAAYNEAVLTNNATFRPLLFRYIQGWWLTEAMPWGFKKWNSLSNYVSIKTVR